MKSAGVYFLFLLLCACTPDNEAPIIGEAPIIEYKNISLPVHEWSATEQIQLLNELQSCPNRIMLNATLSDYKGVRDAIRVNNANTH